MSEWERLARPLVARERELAAIDAFLTTVGSGPAALIVAGEAGIGKSVLVAHTLARSAAHGWRVLHAAPAESEADLAYAALTDLLADAFDEVRTQLPPPQRRALEAALLFADVGVPIEPRQVASALATTLRVLEMNGPLVVAVDDVQWLDGPSEQALSFAVRRLPSRVGIVVARRTADGQSAAQTDEPLGLSRALPPHSRHRLTPQGLSLAGIHHLLRQDVAAPLPRPILARVAAASAGNPYFALELARAIGHRSDGLGTLDPLPLTSSLSALVEARIGALAAAPRRLAQLAALMRRPRVGPLLAAFGSPAHGRGVIAAGEAAAVLLVEGERVRFTHPLLASAVLAMTTGADRADLHGRLAAVVDDFEERAHHLALATSDADETVAATIANAAEMAAGRGVQETAAELFAAASRLTPEEHADRLAARLIGWASASLAIGDLPAARRVAERATAVAVDSLLKAQALFVLGDLAWADGTVRAANARLSEALLAAAGDPALEARIHVRLVAFNVALDPAGAVAHAEAAMRTIDPATDPGLVAYLLFNRQFAGALIGQGSNPDLLERALDLERRAGADTTRSSLPLIWYHQTDAFDEARARHAEDDAWHRDRGEDTWRAERRSHLALVELRAGNWQLAQRHAEEACAEIERFDAPKAWPIPFAWRSLVDAHHDRTDQARATLLPLIGVAEEAGQDWLVGLMLSVLGFVEYAAGNHEGADVALTRMRRIYDSLGIVEPLGDRSEPMHIELLLERGQLDQARRLLDRLEERGRILLRPWIAVALPRARALVLAAESGPGAALPAFDELDRESAERLPFELAWTLLVQGRILRRLRRKRTAAAVLRDAYDRFARLGAPRWQAAAAAELARVGLRHRAPNELTETERRIAELAASGMTNAEVARAAFVTVKTVEANLARVYRKLDIRSRAGSRTDGTRYRQDVGFHPISRDPGGPSVCVMEREVEVEHGVYLVETYQPGASVAQLQDRLAAECRALRRAADRTASVELRTTTVVPDDQAVLTILAAPSADAVADAYRQAGLTFDRISPALTHDFKEATR